MSEENKNELENEEVVETVAEETAEEVVEETTEDVVEEVAEVAEETTEDAPSEVVEDTTTEEVVEEAAEEVVEDTPVESVEGEVMNAPKKNGAKIAIIAGICVVVVAIVVAAILLLTGNKYNRKYIDTTGRTIAEVADLMGYDYADFLAKYQLPADMPKNTYESAAMYTMPLSAISEMYGMSVDELKTELELGDDVTETTTWGDAQDQATLANFVGEEALEQFKEQYGLGDDITGETKWGEVRQIVDQFERDKMLEALKAQEEAQNAAEEEVAPEGEAVVEDAPSEEAPAEESETAESAE